MNQYWSPLQPVLVTKCTYTDSHADQYWFIFRPHLVSTFRVRPDNRSKVLTAGTRYCFTPNNLE